MTDDDDEPPLEPTKMPKSDAERGAVDGLATGLQPGGIIPGGGPGATVGSLGSGGGSNADTPTGDAGENQIEEPVR
jgi:hypothetical protein